MTEANKISFWYYSFFVFIC